MVFKAMKKNLLNFSILDLETIFLDLKEPRYRAKQLLNWIYVKKVFDIQKMSNFSEQLKTKLIEKFEIKLPQIHTFKYSKIDNSYKFIIKTSDNNFIESLAMLEDKRVTLCLSSMIGCPLKCKFCATGTLLRFKRNLECSEILGQFILVQDFLKTKITNIVYMGMGEPLLNRENVEKSIEILRSKDILNFSKNRITISTSGISKNLATFINKLKVKLAVSINFSTNKQRCQFMPVCEKYPLNILINELKKIILSKRDYITIEYLMINNLNDSLDDAIKLRNLFKDLKVKVNLIPYNPIKNFWGEPSSEDKINTFAKYLKSQFIFVSVRRSKGKNINGGCGQFALTQ